ncbi:MAG TPA: Rieske 2Fe-2S domain-containing protein [Acidobacteriaceae bacterium]|nr:Rieske 2Fe-2S domain-containing protein [Acidobacteriaceae bacterium]
MSDEEKREGWAFIAASLLGWWSLGFVARWFVKPPKGISAPSGSAGSSPRHLRSQPDRDADAGSEIADHSDGRRYDANTGAHFPKHPQWGTVLVGLSLAVAFAGGIGFLVAYWTGRNNMQLGGTLALFFGGFGFALVVWAHSLSTNIEETEPREPLAAPTPDLGPAIDDFRRGERDIQRRGLLKWSAAAGISVFAAMCVSTLRSFSLSPDSTLYSTIWKRGQRLVTGDGKPVSVDALQPGSTTIVFPEGSIGAERAQTVLIRVRQDLLRLPQKREGWAPMGNLAYSRVCTHAGCTVGMYEATTHLLMCPCHQSTFNVLDGCEPTGGPAARPLPQLPLYVDGQGFLRAAGGFTEPPGPGFWGMP